MAKPRSGRQWQEGLSTLGHDNLAAEEEAHQTAQRQQVQQQAQYQTQPTPQTPAPYDFTKPTPASTANDLELMLAATKRRLAVVATIAIVVIAISIIGFLVLSRGSTPVSPAAFKVPATDYPIPSKATYLSPSGVDSAPGTAAEPLKTLPKALSKTPTGGTIVLRSGTYYNVALGGINKKVTIQPYPGETVWLKGSAVVTGWNADGNTWRHDNWTTTFCRTCVAKEAVDPKYPLAGWPDQVFINNEPLTQVASKGAVGPGKFYVDYNKKALYVGSNPGGKTVESSTQWRALQLNSGAAGSIIRGLGFAQYAPHWNEDQLAAVISNAPDVTFENNTFVQNAGTALGVFQANNKLLNNYIGYNGYRGVGGNRTHNLVVKNNTIDNNNTEHFATGGCGAFCTVAGMKLAHADNLTISDNYFRNNSGAGFWCDLGCSDTTMTRNVVTGNKGNGLYYEVSTRAVIASNIIANNDRGLKISGSDKVQVYNNTFARNQLNIGVYDDGRAASTDNYSSEQGMTWNTTDVELRNNIFSNNDGSGSPFYDSNAQQVNSKQMISRMDHNAWFRTKSSTPSTMFRWCTPKCAAYSSVDAFQKATGINPGPAIDNRSTNPYFVDESKGNYTLTEDSPARKAGVALPANVAKAIGVQADETVNLGALSWVTKGGSSLGSGTDTPTNPSDTEKPKVSFSLPEEGATLSGAVALTAAATDNTAVASVTFSVDGSEIGTAEASPFMYSWGSQTVGNGEHTLTAVATDTNGNSASTSITVTVSNRADTTPPPSADGDQTLSFAATDDATIVEGSPNSNHGNDGDIMADNSPRRDFLLKFSINSLTNRRVVGAKLKLHAVDAGDAGLAIFQARHNNWNQRTVTWNAAPWVFRPELATLGSINKDKTYTVDVSSFVKGEGTFSFRGVLDKSNGVKFSSREGQDKPELILTVR